MDVERMRGITEGFTEAARRHERHILAMKEQKGNKNKDLSAAYVIII